MFSFATAPLLSLIRSMDFPVFPRSFGAQWPHALPWHQISSSAYSWLNFFTGLNLEHNKYYYVTIEAVNRVGQTARAYSDAIIIDDTYPIGGVVVELSSEYYINGTVGFSSWENVTCVDYDGKVTANIVYKSPLISVLCEFYFTSTDNFIELASFRHLVTEKRHQGNDTCLCRARHFSFRIWVKSNLHPILVFV